MFGSVSDPLHSVNALPTRFKPLRYYYLGVYLLYGAILLFPDGGWNWIIPSVAAGLLAGSQLPAGYWRAGGNVTVEPAGVRHRSKLIEWERIAGTSRRIVGAGPTFVACGLILHVREENGFDLRPLGVFRSASTQQFESLIAAHVANAGVPCEKAETTKFWRLSAYSALSWGLGLVLLQLAGAAWHQLWHLALFFVASLAMQFFAWTRTRIA